MSPVTPVGIDLGTSFCAVSFIDADGRSQMIPNENGGILTPSAVCFGDERVSVGDSAIQAALESPDRVAENAKRDMGLAAYRQSIDGKEYPPEVIQSCLLRQLRRDVIAAVGEDFQAVITVPAYFDEPRRKATFDAAFMSGLDVLDIVNEPTAAALSFGERLGYLTSEGAPRERMNVLVYDLGGGTFDVSVIRLAADEIRTLATDGDYELGGENWDQRLAEHFQSRFQQRWPDAPASTRLESLQLRRIARQAKHALTDAQLTVVEFTRGGRQLKIPVTREELEELTADLLERTVFTARQTLQAAGLIWSEIDRLLLVGGSSRMPAVRRALSAVSGITPEAAVNPDEAVARGAAVYARYLLGQRGSGHYVPKLRIADVNSHSLGLEGVNLDTLLKQNVPLIPRNTSLPCEVKRTFVTRTHNQPNVKIQLLEGESSLPDHCSRLATAMIKNLPPGLPKGTPIDVRYSLQSNGRLAVTAAVPGHGVDAQIELQRVRGLNDRRVQGWKKIVCRDGGYRDYEDALALLLEPNAAENDAADEWDATPSNTKSPTKLNLDPAVEFGAPRAAANALHQELRELATRSTASATVSAAPSDSAAEDANCPQWSSSSHRAQRKQRPLVNLLGHIVFATLGLLMGYYLLCWVRPDLNHLGLNLPGLRQPASPQRN
jgi:molecular chaperone DnaK